MKLGRPRNWNISAQVADELKQAAHAARSARDKERLTAALLAVQGVLSLEQIAQAVGRARSCVQSWLEKLTEGGVAGLLQRRKAPGAPPALSEAQQRLLAEELARGKHRTADQVGAWIQQQWGVELTRKGVYYWLGKFAAVLRVPRPQHRQHDAQRAAEFRFSLLERLHGLNLPKDRPVRIWLEDEGRFGLHGFSRRVWTLRGHKPVAPMQQSYQWFYTFAALECSTGRLETAYWSSVDLEITTRFLEQICASEPEAVHVVIYDGAGFHPREGLHRLPPQVRLIQLPPYSPELNPVEGLWDILRDQQCNRVFESLNQLQEHLTTTLQGYWSQATKVSRLIHGWIRRSANASSPNIIPAFN